ncbi:2-phospho-L-lactate guanylyltransferase [Intrasporangium sp.]|uniref:2-phospho-L-lactate guanylyltransferase n=1 Tax=Intrasporangium sp. TaxID=1925024 RepID=UPI0032218B60
MLTATPRAPACNWHVVVPVKDTRHGKSRLAPAGALRTRLSRALADDTLSAVVAAVGAARTWLVTADTGLSEHWTDVGVHVVPDPGRGLNAAIRAGLAQLPEGPARAVLLGDLPCLTPDDLAAALGTGGCAGEWFVPDEEGSGTVLRGGRVIVPEFGAHSAAAHAGQGAARLELDLPRLRHDVDDPQSLAAAVRLGLGPATRVALGLAVPPGPDHRATSTG